MTATGLIALIVYAVMILPAWYVVGGALAWVDPTTAKREGYGGKTFKSGDLVFGIVCGFFCSLVWPVSLPWALIAQLNGMDHERAQAKAEKLLFVPAKVKAEVVSERANRKERERKRLERETGMDT